MKKKKKRIRIKWKNIFGLLFTILFIVGSIKLFFMHKSSEFNKKIYNDIKGENLTIKLDKKYLKLNDSNLEYIKGTNVKVRIINNGNSYIIDNDKLTNKTYIRLDTYSKRINKEGFNHSKALFIEDKKIGEGQLTIKLPKYLYQKKFVDIYGVKNDKYEKLEARVKVKDESVTFTKYEKYDKYAVTFIELKNLNVTSSVSVLKGSSVKINVVLDPENATNYLYKFMNVDKKYISINDNEVTGIKAGTTTFNVVSNDGKVNKEVKVTIRKSNYKVTEKNGIYYVDGIMIVNKSYPISKDYDPKDILPDAKKAYEKMKKAAKEDDIDLWIVSGYRSYETQKIIYDNYVTANGKEKADTFSARPGYSEHQTGYVMDLNDATSNFEDTKAAKWLDKNAYKYGFIIRFPKGKEKYTGYKYEPWHVRYVGVEKALKIYKSGLSLEEYYNLKSEYKDE